MVSSGHWTWVAASFSRGIILLSTANVQDGAKTSVMNTFLGKVRAYICWCLYFDPFASLNAASSLSSSFKNHHSTKKRAYLQWIWKIQHALLTPVVMSVKSGLAHETTYYYKGLASYCSCLISGGWVLYCFLVGSYCKWGLIFCSNGLVVMLLVIYFVMLCYSLCLWGLLGTFLWLLQQWIQ